MDKEMPVSAWNDWKIIEKIGEGSFGKVYKAKYLGETPDGAPKYSAIKVMSIPANQSELESIRAEAQDDEYVRAYFKGLVDDCTEEVMMMVRLHGDSNIVSVEDCKVVEYLDAIGWDIFIRMEYLTGFTDYYSENMLTEQDVVRLGIDLCSALEHCRERNIIHRDIKPENIFVTDDGEFKLGDFGIARQIERTMSVLSKKGTSSYMAPEMYRGERYDCRADIYSLGLVLYKLLNHNRLPFLSLKKQLITYRDKELAMAKRMAGQELFPPVEASDALSKVILKACAFYPDYRYEKAEDLLADLKFIQNGKDPWSEREKMSEQDGKQDDLLGEEDEPDSLAEKKKRSGGKNRILIGIAGTLFAVILCLAGVFLYQYKRPENSQHVNSKELKQELDRIAERATLISSQLGEYNWVEDTDVRIQYFDSSWQLMKVLVYPAASEDGVFEEYYYWYGKCFFAYIWSEDEVNYYYYKDGELIRWIDSENKCHDCEISNPEYVSRGEKYYGRSEAEMEKVQNGTLY